jgi:hypothetical protein
MTACGTLRLLANAAAFPLLARADIACVTQRAIAGLGSSSLAAYLVFAQDEIKAWIWTRGSAGFPSGQDVLEGDRPLSRSRC